MIITGQTLWQSCRTQIIHYDYHRTDSMTSCRTQIIHYDYHRTDSMTKLQHTDNTFFFYWLIGCGCLNRQVAHIVFDGAPRVLWATIYLLPELRVEQYWYMVKSPRVVTARVFFVLGRFFYFHPQCQGRRHLHFTWYASHEGHTP